MIIVDAFECVYCARVYRQKKMRKSVSLNASKSMRPLKNARAEYAAKCEARLKAAREKARNWPALILLVKNGHLDEARLLCQDYGKWENWSWDRTSSGWEGTYDEMIKEASRS